MWELQTIDWLMDWFIHSFVHSFICWLIDWIDSIRFDFVSFKMIDWLDLICFDLINWLIYLIWFDWITGLVDWFDLIWLIDWLIEWVSDWLDWIALEWIGLNWIGLDDINAYPYAWTVNFEICIDVQLRTYQPLIRKTSQASAWCHRYIGYWMGKTEDSPTGSRTNSEGWMPAKIPRQKWSISYLWEHFLVPEHQIPIWLVFVLGFNVRTRV